VFFASTDGLRLPLLQAHTASIASALEFLQFFTALWFRDLEQFQVGQGKKQGLSQ